MYTVHTFIYLLITFIFFFILDFFHDESIVPCDSYFGIIIFTLGLTSFSLIILGYAWGFFRYGTLHISIIFVANEFTDFYFSIVVNFLELF